LRPLRPLLEEEEASWRRLCELFDAVTGDAWERPGANGPWTPKDVMAHIAAWHAVTTDRLECLRSVDDLPDAPDVDTFNEEQYQRCKQTPLHDALAMFGGSRHRFREELALLGEEVDDRLAVVIVANGAGHYAEHLSDLEAFVKENA